jgi:hypothetical protein
MDKIINLLINNWTKGVDTYTHNGSTWLIFTEQKSWVIELTENKTLWYNYNFFKELFSLTSMDVVDNQHYITKWVEDNVINKELTYVTLFRDARDRKQQFEDTIQNGVKETKISPTHTEYGDWLDGDVRLDEIIENGVIMSNPRQYVTNKILDDAIENGVKETQFNDNENKSWVEGVIQNGVKETHDDSYHHKDRIDGVIKNGVKETHREICEYKKTIDYIIKTGIKETKTPGKDGDIMSTIEWMEENKSTSYTKMIDDVIENGVKEVVSYDEHKRGPINAFGYIDDIIKEGEKINGTYAGGQRQSEKCKSVVEYGIKNPTV